MIGFNHAAAGIIIGATVPLPYVPIVALISHFIMDALPHFGNSDTFKPYNKPFVGLLVFDAVMCFVVLGTGIYFMPDKIPALILGTFFATLPDFMWPLEGKAHALRPYFKFAKKIQKFEISDGWTYEIIFFTIAVVLFVLIV